MSIDRMYRHLFTNGRSRIRSFGQCLNTRGTAAVHAMRLSPLGDLLAIGDDNGLLEIRMQDGSDWKSVGLYAAGAAIRALEWHPTKHATVLIGSANGGVHMVTVGIDGGDDTFLDGLVAGYVHTVAFNPDGSKLAIAHGTQVSVVTDPFRNPDTLGTLTNIHIPPVLNPINSANDAGIPRGMFFLHDALIIAFLGTRGIRLFSTIDHTPLWEIPLRQGCFLGSVAISPSGDRLAVMNMRNSTIEYYSVTHRQYMSSIKIARPRTNYLVSICFVDEDTVVYGHCDGYIGFASCGFMEASANFLVHGRNLEVPIQTVCFGITRNGPLVFVVAPATSTSSYGSEIHTARIEGPDGEVVVSSAVADYARRGHRYERIMKDVYAKMNAFTTKDALLMMAVFSTLGLLLQMALHPQASNSKPAVIIPSTPRQVLSKIPSGITTTRRATVQSKVCVITMTGTLLAVPVETET